MRRCSGWPAITAALLLVTFTHVLAHSIVSHDGDVQHPTKAVPKVDPKLRSFQGAVKESPKNVAQQNNIPQDSINSGKLVIKEDLPHLNKIHGDSPNLQKSKVLPPKDEAHRDSLNFAKYDAKNGDVKSVVNSQNVVESEKNNNQVKDGTNGNNVNDLDGLLRNGVYNGVKDATFDKLKRPRLKRIPRSVVGDVGKRLQGDNMVQRVPGETGIDNGDGIKKVDILKGLESRRNVVVNHNKVDTLHNSNTDKVGVIKDKTAGDVEKVKVSGKADKIKGDESLSLLRVVPNNVPLHNLPGKNKANEKTNLNQLNAIENQLKIKGLSKVASEKVAPQNLNQRNNDIEAPGREGENVNLNVGQGNIGQQQYVGQDNTGQGKVGPGTVLRQPNVHKINVGQDNVGQRNLDQGKVGQLVDQGMVHKVGQGQERMSHGNIGNNDKVNLKAFPKNPTKDEIVNYKPKDNGLTNLDVDLKKSENVRFDAGRDDNNNNKDNNEGNNNKKDNEDTNNDRNDNDDNHRPDRDEQYQRNDDQRNDDQRNDNDNVKEQYGTGEGKMAVHHLIREQRMKHKNERVHNNLKYNDVNNDNQDNNGDNNDNGQQNVHNQRDDQAQRDDQNQQDDANSYNRNVLEHFRRMRNNRQNNQQENDADEYVQQDHRSVTETVPPVPYDGSDFAINLSNMGYIEFKIRRSPISSAGQPWPLPQYYRIRENKMFRIDKSNFRFILLTPECDILISALKRYHLFITKFSVKDPYENLENAPHLTVTKVADKYLDPLYRRAKLLPTVDVKLRDSCVNATYPPVDMDETYNILVMDGTAVISANQIWGMLRGLETFSQLVFQGADDRLYIRDVAINDYPRFQHRGILLDTSRHYMFKDTIYDVIDAMAMNKMNVLHWHIVDDQSFPYESKVFPNLSKKGAFHPDLVYTHKDIKEILDFARLRGIRVMPEFDTPGHTYSWGLSHPELLTKCQDSNVPYPGPLNPTLNSTYAFLYKLLKEVSEVFPDEWMHLGGDEVPLSCWSSNPQLMQFLENLDKRRAQDDDNDNNGQSYQDPQALMKYYETKLLAEFRKVQKTRKLKQRPVFWQEVIDNVDNLPNDSIIHIWKGGASDIQRAINLGYHTLYSTCWYLDWIAYGGKWDKYYMCDPFIEPYEEGNEEYNNDNEQRNQGGEKIENPEMLLGGEAAIWAEYIDNEQIINYLWPRASATAERLWSHKDVRNVQEASVRIQEQRCRMLGRGLSVGQVSGPDYCPSRGPRKHRSASSLWADSIKQKDIKPAEDERAPVRVPLAVNMPSYIQHGKRMPSTNWGLPLMALTLVILSAIAITYNRSGGAKGNSSSRSHIWRNRSFLAVLITMVYLTSFTTIWLTATAHGDDRIHGNYR